MIASQLPRSSRRRRTLTLAGFVLLACTGYGYAIWWPTATLFTGTVSALPQTEVSKRIALTFDDGPDPAVTPRILDALRDAGAHATFFFCGERAAHAPDLVKRTHAEGHAIGNHSWRHDALVFASTPAIADDLDRTNAALRTAIGDPATSIVLFRPPFGLRDWRVLREASSRGMTSVMWSVSPRDWQAPEPSTIVERVLADARDGAIVLLHDGDARKATGRPHTADALPQILAELSRRGFRCVALDPSSFGSSQ